MLASGIVGARQLARLRLRIGRTHQSTADEHRIDPNSLQLFQLLARGNTALGNDRLARRHIRHQLVGSCDIYVERSKISVVDPDDLGIKLKGFFELHGISYLDNAVEIQFLCLGVEHGENISLQGGDDQENSVCPKNRRLVQLVSINREVLAEHRKIARFPSLAQILQPAFEVRYVRKDRKSRGAAPLVGANLISNRRRER